MGVTTVEKDAETLTMTVTAEFEASLDEIWQMWADPRKLERWWGPPTYPATFLDHDLRPDGRVTYFMTGPDGDKPRGWWRVISVDAPTSLEFEDGFADDSGNPNPDMPVMIMKVAIAEQGGGTTRMTIDTVFPSTEAMEQIISMGMEEGMTSAIDQIDGILAAA